MDDVQILEAGASITDPLAPYAQVDRTRAGDGCWVMANMVGGLDGSAGTKSIKGKTKKDAGKGKHKGKKAKNAAKH